MEIRQINDSAEKQSIARYVLEALPDWFGIPETREEYIKSSAEQPFFCACDGGNPLGFQCLKETGKDTVELAVMGVLKEYHRSGIGKELFNQAKKSACEKGYSFLQVKTGQMEPMPDICHVFMM